MTRTFFEHQESILVAISFDRHSTLLVNSAAALCRRLGKKLHLIHVVEPWVEQSPSRPFEKNSPLWNVTQAVEQNSRELAQNRLTELAQKIENLEVTLQVLSGKVADRLSAYALAAGACLVIIGAGSSRSRFVPRGLSTALSLMASAVAPVMVLDEHMNPSFTKPALKILLADDLGEPSEKAVDFAFDLTAALMHSDLHHVHVNSLTEETLQAGLETAAAASYARLSTEASQEIYQSYLQTLAAQLEARSMDRDDYIEAAGGSYTSELLTGHITDELEGVTTSFNPDVIVFGRHQTLHRKPFMIGQVPFSFMLAHQRPVIIVPND